MVKSIIKRIIVGVGIALVLMALKDGGLIATAYAMSCDADNYVFAHPFNGAETFTWNATDFNAGNWVGLDLNSDYSIPFESDDAYIEILVPTQYSFHAYDSAGSSANTHLQMSSLNSVFIDNTKGNNAWVLGYYENNYVHFKFFKKSYSNYNAIKLSGFRFNAPKFYGNWSSVYGWLKVEDYWQVYHYKCDSNQALQNAIDENTQAVEDVNDTLNNSSTDDPTGNISTMNGKVASNNSITQLLTLPIQMYQNILNAVSGSCSSFSLGSLYNHNLTLPCINLQNLLGSTLYGIIDILISGLFILSFRKKMVDIFNHMTSLNDRGNELE